MIEGSNCNDPILKIEMQGFIIGNVLYLQKLTSSCLSYLFSFPFLFRLDGGFLQIQ